MIIKKFQGKTQDEALALAKKELGEDLVVMNVKSVPPKGFWRIFKPSLMEVTVAKEEESEIAMNKRKEEEAAKESEIASVIASVDKLRKQSELHPEKESVNAEPGLGEKLDNIQSLLEEKLRKTEGTEEKEEDNIPDEKSEEMMSFLKLLYHTMIENEVSETYANQMIEDIEKNFQGDEKMEHVLSHIYQKMILKLGKVQCISPSQNGKVKVIYFVGPTGVGKTTTLAKIASILSVEKQKKIALFTADTYRISATDQLRTYANILNVPMHIIYTAEEMVEQFAKYEDYDYILVDTAGHSHKNEEQKEKTKEFVEVFDEKAEKEVYLVLSATTKYKDLLSITKAYQDMTGYKLIFTKLDETTTCGNLLNLRLQTGAPLSYVTCGQNVPEDIAPFDPQSTVKKILGGKA